MEKDEIDKEYYNQLFELYKESGAQFDKQVLYISSGALGITITFISDIVSLDCAVYKYLLTIAWSILSLIILMGLLSHYLSKKALNFRMENLYDSYDEKSKRNNSWVEKLNVFMLIGLPLGIILIVIFISLNI